jgi:hypothetical protein
MTEKEKLYHSVKEWDGTLNYVAVSDVEAEVQMEYLDKTTHVVSREYYNSILCWYIDPVTLETLQCQRPTLRMIRYKAHYGL